MKAASNEENADYSLPPFWIGITFIRIVNIFRDSLIAYPTIQFIDDASFLRKPRRCCNRCNGGTHERRPSA